MKLTTNGLKLVDRIDLARTQGTSYYNATRLYSKCQAIHRADYSPSVRYRKFKNLFWWSGLSAYKDQNENVEFPVECISAKVSGGHNADFAPDNKRIYIGNAAGYMTIVNVDSWKIENTVDTGGLLLDKQAGSGHTCFAGNKNLAIVTNHKASYATVINLATQRKVKNIQLPYSKENIFSAYQSHTYYVDKEQDYYYNFWTDGGVFYKISLNSLNIVDSLYTGGIPIQGNYISLDNIMSTTTAVTFAAVNDSAQSDGEAITINVLDNDTGENIVLEEVDPASHGQAKIVNGKIVYTPNLGFSGEDSFWYGISSTASTSWEWALITVTVESTTPPVELKAYDDKVTVSSGTEITIDVLSNDTGSNLSIGWVDDASNGNISIVNNKLVYVSNSSFTGTEDFWYEVVNSTGESTWGNVVITVGDSNSSNVSANADSETVTVGQTVTIDALANDSGRELTIFEVDPAWTGSISVDNNKLVYTADNSFTGSIEIWYGIEDVTGMTDWGKVTITITD